MPETDIPHSAAAFVPFGMGISAVPGSARSDQPDRRPGRLRWLGALAVTEPGDRYRCLIRVGAACRHVIAEARAWAGRG
jgi:hypothetical protein